LFRRLITDLMCRFETCWTPAEAECPALALGLLRLEEMVADGLLEHGPFHLRVTPRGRPFLRNACMALDARLWEEKPEGRVFSRAV
jgi:oxygen-independent coproporphyrinogen-3 oxidase